MKNLVNYKFKVVLLKFYYISIDRGQGYIFTVVSNEKNKEHLEILNAMTNPDIYLLGIYDTFKNALESLIELYNMDSEKEINRLFEKGMFKEDTHLRILNGLISKMSHSEQLGLHSKLNDNALTAVYKLIGSLMLNYCAKEHIVWYYYVNMHQRTSDVIDDSIFNKLLNDYDEYRFGALISLVIDLIRKKQITLEQICRAKDVMDDKEIYKQYHNYKTINDVNNGVILSRERVCELLDLNAFDGIMYALDIGMILKDALDEFIYPEKGAPYREIITIIHDKVQKMRCKRYVHNL